MNEVQGKGGRVLTALDRLIQALADTPGAASALESEIQELRASVQELQDSRKALETRAAESRQIAREAREAATEMEAILNNLADAVIVFDQKGIARRANSFAVAILGFDPLNRPWSQIIKQIHLTGRDLQPDIPNPFSFDLSSEPDGMVVNYPFELTNRHGRTYKILGSMMPLYTGKEFGGMVTLMKDVTRHEALMAENENQRQLLEQIVREAPVGIAILDEPGHRYQLVNPYYVAHASGKGGLVGRTFAEVWPEVGDQVTSLLDQVVESGQAYTASNAPFQIIRSQGYEEAYFSFSLIPLLGADQKINRVMILLQETTTEVLSRRAQDADQALLQAIFENAPVSISVVAGPDLRYIMTNPATRTSSPKAGDPSSASDSVDLLPGGKAALREVIETRSPRRWRGLYRQTGLENRPAWWNIDQVPLPGPDGSIDRVLILGQEVTQEVLGHRRLEGEVEERRRIERALRQNEERLRLATEASEIGVWEQDLRSGLLVWDQRCRTLFGLAPGETVSLERFKQAVHPEDQAMVNSSGREESGDKPYELEYRVIWPDGSLHWIYERGRSELDEDGLLLRLTGVILDITERKQAEDERERLMDQLAAEHAWLDAVLEALPVAVWISDREGRLVRKNRQADVIWAGDAPLPESIDGYGIFRGWWPGTDKEVRPEEWPLARILLEGKLSASDEFDIERLDKTRGTIWTSAAQVRDAEGRLLGGVVVTQDISERRRLEARHIEFITQMEVQRRLLEHREQERQSIARELHDGPIQDTISLVFMIQSALTLNPEGETNQILRDLRVGTQRLVRELRSVCNDLRPPALMHLGLERAIRSHAESYKAHYPDLTFRLDLMEDIGALPDHTRLALYRIYQEGLLNVIRHASASQVVIRLQLTPGMVVLEITDNGHGFTVPADLVTLAREGHFGVVGMNERAEAVGGILTIASEPGKGTAVRVEVPRQ